MGYGGMVTHYLSVRMSGFRSAWIVRMSMLILDLKELGRRE